jgi:hypothetical protein
VTAIHLEAVVPIDRAQERLQLRGGKLDHGLARLADEVLMLFVGEVVDRASVAEVDVIDHADLLERIERAVDGRDVDGRETSVDVGREFFRGDVSVRGEDRFDDHLPRRGSPTAGRSERIEDGICIHGHLQSYGKKRTSHARRMIPAKQRGGSPKVRIPRGETAKPVEVRR